MNFWPRLRQLENLGVNLYVQRGFSSVWVGRYTNKCNRRSCFYSRTINIVASTTNPLCVSLLQWDLELGLLESLGLPSATAVSVLSWTNFELLALELGLHQPQRAPSSSQSEVQAQYYLEEVDKLAPYDWVLDLVSCYLPTHILQVVCIARYVL